MPVPDWYRSAPGTLLDEFGQRIDFNLNSDASVDPITHGMLVPLDFHGGGTAVDYQNDIEGCNGQLHAISETAADHARSRIAGWLSTTLESTRSSRQDPLATWDAFANRVANSCAPGCGAVSPRLIPVVLFDPDELRRWANHWYLARLSRRHALRQGFEHLGPFHPRRGGAESPRPHGPLSGPDAVGRTNIRRQRVVAHHHDAHSGD